MNQGDYFQTVHPSLIPGSIRNLTDGHHCCTTRAVWSSLGLGKGALSLLHMAAPKSGHLQLCCEQGDSMAVRGGPHGRQKGCHI
jgi:hypothetical protein